MKALTFRALTAMAVAGAALMIFAGGAFANAFTSGGSVYEGEIEASGSQTVGGVKCDSSFKGQVEPPFGMYAMVKVSQMSFTNCPEGKTVTATLPATLGVAYFVPSVSIAAMEATITITSHQTGVSCSYLPSGSAVSRFYPSFATGATAKIGMLQPYKIEKWSASCAEKIEWLGTYTVTTPDELNVH